MKVAARAIAIVAALFYMAGPRAAAEPQTRAAPERIISLVPAATEMLFAMGAGPDVVGVSSYDTFPPEAQSRPKLGALVDPDFERVLALRPTLVVVYGSQADLIAKLTRAGLSVFRVRSGDVADILDTIRQLGRRIGHAQDADRVAAGIVADLARVRARVAGRPRPKTALVFERDEGTLRDIYASGGIGFLHDILLVAGGDDVFGDVKTESVQASIEMLLARAPEAIVELRPSAGWTPARMARERAVWNGLPGLPAVRRNQIYFLADDRISIPGPRVAESALLIAEALHPEIRSAGR